MHLQIEKPRRPFPPTRVQTKRILLLEDDEELKAIVKEYLEANLYEVIAVSNGVAGVREILAGDFQAIVCDMLMPTLPGDMFYMAVERVRPHLCPKFIFMTGLHNNPKIVEFIKRINGTMLPKPFRMDDLLEMIYGVQFKETPAA
jgi:DNA-binding response OmpR family regulator